MRDELIKQLQSYRGCLEEIKLIPQFIELMNAKDNCFYRNCFNSGHITGSGLLINGAGDKVLLNHHKSHGKWLTFGGHADGEEDIAAVALREAIEESGIESIDFAQKEIFDIDIHPIPMNVEKQEDAHHHFDIIFLLQAKTENFHLSDESCDLRWCSYDEAKSLVQSDMRMNRVLSKWSALSLSSTS